MVTNKQMVLSMLKAYPNGVTLGEFLRHPAGIGYSARTRICELRQEGYDIQCVRGETPSMNKYILKKTPTFDKSGQGIMI